MQQSSGWRQAQPSYVQPRAPTAAASSSPDRHPQVQARTSSSPYPTTTWNGSAPRPTSPHRSVRAEAHAIPPLQPQSALPAHPDHLAHPSHPATSTRLDQNVRSWRRDVADAPASDPTQGPARGAGQQETPLPPPSSTSSGGSGWRRVTLTTTSPSLDGAALPRSFGPAAAPTASVTPATARTPTSSSFATPGSFGLPPTTGSDDRSFARPLQGPPSSHRGDGHVRRAGPETKSSTAKPVLRALEMPTLQIPAEKDDGHAHDDGAPMSALLDMYSRTPLLGRRGSEILDAFAEHDENDPVEVERMRRDADRMATVNGERDAYGHLLNPPPAVTPPWRRQNHAVSPPRRKAGWKAHGSTPRASPHAGNIAVESQDDDDVELDGVLNGALDGQIPRAQEAYNRAHVGRGTASDKIEKRRDHTGRMVAVTSEWKKTAAIAQEKKVAHIADRQQHTGRQAPTAGGYKIVSPHTQHASRPASSPRHNARCSPPRQQAQQHSRDLGRHQHDHQRLDERLQLELQEQYPSDDLFGLRESHDRSPKRHSPRRRPNGVKSAPFAAGPVWSTSLTDFADEAVDAVLCLPCQLSRQYSAVVKAHVDTVHFGYMVAATIFCPLNCLFALQIRGLVKERYRIDEDCSETCVAVLCPPLSACQTHRELTRRGVWPGGAFVDAPRSYYGRMR